MPESKKRSASGAPGKMERPKRTRVNFTSRQLEALEKVFEQSQYPDVTVLETLAERMGLAIEKVCTWFQNRRSKFRKESKNGHIDWMRKQLFAEKAAKLRAGVSTSHVLTPSTETPASSASSDPLAKYHLPNPSIPHLPAPSQLPSPAQFSPFPAEFKSCYRLPPHTSTITAPSAQSTITNYVSAPLENYTHATYQDSCQTTAAAWGPGPMAPHSHSQCSYGDFPSYQPLSVPSACANLYEDCQQQSQYDNRLYNMTSAYSYQAL